MVNFYKSAYHSAKTNGFGKAYKIAAGFDGCIDYIMKPIGKTTNERNEHFQTISSFGEYIMGKASLSCCIEMDKQIVKAGGNMPNFATALSELDCFCDCIGTLGYPELREEFRNMGNNVVLTSVAETGLCTALEFNDGKVMLVDNDGPNSLDYSLLVNKIGKKRLVDWLNNADALALLNWSELPGMTSVWRGILSDLLPHTTFKRKKLLLIDVSDCSKHTSDEIRKMTDMMKEFSRYYNVVFSLNQNECNAISAALDLKETNAKKLYDALTPYLVVLHLLDGAHLCSSDLNEFIPQNKVTVPKLSTGGGDNFNAGLTFSLLAGMNPGESVAFGNVASKFYIENGRSASVQELMNSIKIMANEAIS